MYCENCKHYQRLTPDRRSNGFDHACYGSRSLWRMRELSNGTVVRHKWFDNTKLDFISRDCPDRIPENDLIEICIEARRAAPRG